jgi:hypothetical protein
VPDSGRELLLGFRRAEELHPGLIHESSYRMAGGTVTVRLIGHRLGATLTRALAHLSLPVISRTPDLLIEAWDEAETGVGTPVTRARDDHSTPGTTTVSADGRYVVFEQATTQSVLDRTGRHIVTWVAGAERLTQYELGRPWHSELLLWQRDRGLLPVHAGFIERDGVGVLLGGPGGSGKSTTALVCMRAGWSYLADDYVGIEARPEGGFTGHGIYCSAHLEPENLGKFPEFVPGAIHGKLSREDKSLVLLSTVAGSSLTGTADIRVLALPRVVNADETTFRPARKAEALLRLAPSSLHLLPFAGLGHSGFQTLTTLVEQVPTWWLELGRDREQLPRAVAALVQRVASA